MGLRINTNSSAVTALRSLRNADKAQAKSLERLSTGLRINRASDDPSGLVISEQLRAQIASLHQAVDNTENASNLIGTAEAALAEVSKLLIEIRESALFAMNSGGTSTEQIAAEQDAVDSSIAAIDRIAASTRYSSTQLLDGSSEIQITGKSADVTRINLHSINFDGFASRTMSATITAVAEQASSVTTIATDASATWSAGAALGGDVIFRVSGDRGTQTITLGAGSTGSSLRDAVNLVSLNTGVYASETAADMVIFRSIDFGADSYITVEQVAGDGAFINATAEVYNERGVDVAATIEGMQATGKGNKLSIDSFALSVEMLLSATATGTSYGVGDTPSFTAI
ncbi:flagellin, partial [Planctomycetota bacterium]